MGKFSNEKQIPLLNFKPFYFYIMNIINHIILRILHFLKRSFNFRRKNHDPNHAKKANSSFINHKSLLLSINDEYIISSAERS